MLKIIGNTFNGRNASDQAGDESPEGILRARAKRAEEMAEYCRKEAARYQNETIPNILRDADRYEQEAAAMSAAADKLSRP